MTAMWCPKCAGQTRAERRFEGGKRVGETLRCLNPACGFVMPISDPEVWTERARVRSHGEGGYKAGASEPRGSGRAV